MSKMQAFQAWLFGAQGAGEDEVERTRLARLTEVSPETMAVLKADLDWETWSAVEPAGQAGQGATA